MKAKDKKTLDILREGPLSILPEQEYKMIEDAVKEYGIDGVTGYAASMIADGMRRMAFDMKKYAVEKAKNVNVGDVVLYAVKKPPQATTYATGKVESIKTSGKVSIAGTDESEEASEDKPIATIRVYAETESGLQETDRRVAKPVSELRMTDKKVEKSVESTLKDKVKEHNEEVGDVKSKRTSFSVLQQVYDRGVGAYSSNPSSVRPNVTGREQWAFGRVNGFLHALRTGRFKRSPYDQDLLPEGHRYASDEKKKLDKHGDHDQSSHGDWRKGDDSEGEDSSEEKNPKPNFVPYQDDSEGEFEDLDYDDPRNMDTMDYPRKKK